MSLRSNPCWRPVPTPTRRNTALLESARKGFIVAAQALLAAGADVNARNRKKERPLLLAIEKGFTPLGLALLSRPDIEVNFKDRHGLTPLMWSCVAGRASLVRTMIARGAKVNEKDNSGQTPLMWAAAGQYADLVEVLLAAGADVNARAEHRMTALMVAASKDDPATIKALAEAGAKLHARAENGQTAMMMAAQRGHVAAVRALKQAGAEK